MPASVVASGDGVMDVSSPDDLNVSTIRSTFTALCDQGILSAGNFLTNIVLIRHLPTATFGVFALFLNAIIFFNNIHAAAVTYTICIRGARGTRATVRTVATGGVVATILMAAVDLVGAYLVGAYVKHYAIIGWVCFAAVLWQLQEAFRSSFVSQRRYSQAIPGDGTSYLGQALVLALIAAVGGLSLRVVFFVIGVTSLSGAAMQAWQIKPEAVGAAWLRSFFHDIWRLGRWGVLAKLVAFFCLQGFPWIVAYSCGFAGVAEFQSLLQLVAVVNPIILTANSLVIATVAAHAHRGLPFRAAATKYLLASGILILSYFACLMASPRSLMGLLYGAHSIYLENAALTKAFVTAYGFEFMSMAAGAILGGLGRTRSLVVQQTGGMITALLVVIPLALRHGVVGAAYGLVFVNMAKAVVGWWAVIAGPRETIIGPSIPCSVEPPAISCTE